MRGGKLIDETGNKYGRWTVVQQAPSRSGITYWLCRCECGTEKNVRGTVLRHGDSESCGCLRGKKVREFKVIDEVGNKYGRLTVVEYAGMKYGGAAAWRCKCGCGKETITIGSSLRSGATRSCGCLRSEMSSQRARLPRGKATQNVLFRRYCTDASSRGLSWELTKEQFLDLTQQSCHYCGTEPSTNFAPKGLNGNYIYNGLDRVDNDQGYVLQNVVPCCKTCNLAKQDMSLDEFLGWVKRVYCFQQDCKGVAGGDFCG